MYIDWVVSTESCDCDVIGKTQNFVIITSVTNSSTLPTYDTPPQTQTLESLL